MKNVIIVNQAPHGIGPILRIAEMTQDLYHLLDSKNNNIKFEIVLTEPEKPFIKEILKRETFTNDKILEHIWLSPKFGEFVNAFDFNSSDYKDRLENIVLNRKNLETKLVNSLERGIDAYKLIKPEDIRQIKYDNIFCEVNFNPILRTSIDKKYSSFYVTMGLFSEILSHAKEVNLRYNDFELQSLVKQCIKEAEIIEGSQDLLLISEPSTMTYRGNPNRDNIFDIPPFIRPPVGSTEKLNQGVYLNISGIESVQDQIVSLARPFIDAGYAVYYPPSYKKGIEGGIIKSPVKNGISIFSNSSIIAAVGRMGWSSVWEPMMNGSPFITYEYSENEDPEMHHNIKTLEEFEIGVVMKKGDNPRETMEKALKLRPTISQYTTKLKNKFRTLNGINYAAKVCYNYLLK